MVVLGITSSPEPESPEVISEYPDAIDIAKMGRCALPGKPVSLTSYLLSRFEYINEYAKAKLRRHAYYDFWNGLSKIREKPTFVPEPFTKGSNSVCPTM